MPRVDYDIFYYDFNGRPFPRTRPDYPGKLFLIHFSFVAEGDILEDCHINDNGTIKKRICELVSKGEKTFKAYYPDVQQSYDLYYSDYGMIPYEPAGTWNDRNWITIETKLPTPLTMKTIRWQQVGF